MNESYVNLSLERYNELYDKSKLYDELIKTFGNDLYSKIKEMIENIHIDADLGEGDSKQVINSTQTVQTPSNKNFKFNVGDRVEALKGNDYVKVGLHGTVDESHYIPYVNWDNGERWAVRQERLRKIESGEI